VALAADFASGVTGVVRDPRGTPQMGVLVELVRGNVVATTFTDLEGRYHLAAVTPGIYDLRTSATLFLPTLHRSLQLRAGSGSTLNLTLTGLFDESSWLTLPHRSAANGVDEWKWTLRSPANRPMLRVLDDDSSAELIEARPSEAALPARAHHARVFGSAASGGFGTGGSQLALEMGAQSSDHRSSDAVRVSEGAIAGEAYAPAVSLVASRDRGVGQGTQRRMAVGMRSVPQVRTAAGAGMQVVEVASAQRMEIGSFAAVEVGGMTQVVHSGGTLVVVHPFVQASVLAGGVWLVRYQYATSPESTGMDSFSQEQTLARLPTMVQGRAGVQTEAGSHQECVAGRALGKARLEVAGFYDAEQQVALSGQLHRQTVTTAAMSADAMLDETTGAFRRLTPGSRGSGARVQLEAPFGHLGRISAAYLNGVGFAEQPGGARSAFVSRRASAVSVAVKREIPRTGTQISASYRWQPQAMLTTIGRYERADMSPYLGLHLVQALPLGRESGWHADLLLDATNLTAQGYRPGTEQAQEVYYMSALREMRAGLAVTF